MTYTVNYAKRDNLAREPYKASELSAGFDLYAAIEKPIYIKPGEVEKISTGLSVELPEGTFGAIFPRSGLATKKGLAPANMVGVCDADYRGIYIVALRNYSNEVQVVSPGDRIAQLIILPYINVNFNEVDKLSETKRGEGGFGHSGT